MKTVTIQIGNSDNKLTQVEWSAFARAAHGLIRRHAKEIYFHGFPAGDAPWQNACWVIGIEDDAELKAKLADGARLFDQDAVAWTEGVTRMI